MHFISFRAFAKHCQALFSGAVIAALAINSLYAQQEGLFSANSSNWFLRNPAVAGWEDYIGIQSAYRRQWIGMPQGPDSYYITANAAVNYFEPRGTSLPMLSKSSMGQKAKPKAKEGKWYRHGIGGSLLVQNNRPLRINIAQASYALHFKLSKQAKASIGATIGVRQWRVNADELYLQDLSDPAFEQGFISEIIPSIGIGALVYHPRYFLSVAASQVLEEPLSLSGQENPSNAGILSTHYYLGGGVRMDIGQHWELSPRMMLRYLEPLGWISDFGLQLGYQQKYWGGISYRQGGAAFGGSLGASLRPWMQLFYTYEATSGKSSALGRANHELSLAFRIPVRQYGIKQRYF